LKRRVRSRLKTIASISGHASWIAAAALVVSGCGSKELAVTSHRSMPRSEARIVVLPVALPAALKLPKQEERTLAAICATELLRAYQVLELERFERMLEEKNLALEDVLREGTGKLVAQEMGVDALLVSEVYTWKPGKPGLLFLAKDGSVGYQGRLVDLSSGSLLWSVNRVAASAPWEPLPVAAARVFESIIEGMPHGAAVY
jgi:hypothetical protein